MTIVLGVLRPSFVVLAADSRRAIGVSANGVFRAEGFNDAERKLAVHPTAPFAIALAGTALGVLSLGEELDHLLHGTDEPSVNALRLKLEREVLHDTAVAIASVGADGVAKLARIKLQPPRAPDVTERSPVVFPPSAELREFYEGTAWDRGDTPDEVAEALREAIVAGIREEQRLVPDPMKRVCGGTPSAVIVDCNGARFVASTEG